jgi:hypothetical protein
MLACLHPAVIFNDIKTPLLEERKPGKPVA